MRVVWLFALIVVLSACSGDVSGSTTTTPPASASSVVTTTSTSTTTTTTTTVPTTTTTANIYARPNWLGQRPLPLRPDGLGEIQPTPEVLRDRQLETIDILEPPTSDVFQSSVDAVPPNVLARSTWVEGCPVTPDHLRYLTMSYLGFDQEIHTGEMIVNSSVATEVVEVFSKLYEARYPIEEMRVASIGDLEAPPTGDGNNTTSFSCRPAVGSESWSYHAYGLAIDVNPFHNPYVKDDVVIPELASAYVDREEVRPGMILPGDVVTDAFYEIGWEWGGDWDSPKDYMHFQKPG